MRLELELEDDLALDNVAFAGLTPMRTVSVLVVTPGNMPLELGLKTEKAAKICFPQFVLPSYLDSDEYKLRAKTGNDDLIIYDRCSPSEMPLTNTFFIGALPPRVDGDREAGTATAEPPTAEDQPADNPVAEIPSDDGNESTKPERNWSWSTQPSSVVLIDMDRTHPIMRFMEVFSLLIFNGRAINGPAGSAELIGADIGQC